MYCGQDQEAAVQRNPGQPCTTRAVGSADPRVAHTESAGRQAEAPRAQPSLLAADQVAQRFPSVKLRCATWMRQEWRDNRPAISVIKGQGITRLIRNRNSPDRTYGATTAQPASVLANDSSASVGPSTPARPFPVWRRQTQAIRRRRSTASICNICRYFVTVRRATTSP